MAASPRQRQKAADVLRASRTQVQAAKAANVGVSTIKRWLRQPAFRAMISTSPDINAGEPPRIDGGPRLSQEVRTRMWVASGSEGDGKVLGSYLPPRAYEAAGSVLHVHV